MGVSVGETRAKGENQLGADVAVCGQCAEAVLGQIEAMCLWRRIGPKSTTFCSVQPDEYGGLNWLNTAKVSGTTPNRSREGADKLVC